MVFIRQRILIIVVIMVMAVISEQMSVRRQLDSQPPDTNETPVTPNPVSKKSIPASTQSENERKPKRNPQSTQESPTANEIIDMLVREMNFQNGNRHSESSVTETKGQENKDQSSDSALLTTGNPEMDKLLASLGEPSKNSRALWMALLHGLVSDGSLNEILGNFVQDSMPAKRDGSLLKQEDGQTVLQDPGNQMLSDQTDGPRPSPQTQMEGFSLEPHLGPAILPFKLPEGFFVPFLPRRAFGVVNGVARPPHGHDSFYVHRPPGLVDVLNPPAFGYIFNSYRRFQPGADPNQFHFEDFHHGEFHDDFIHDDQFHLEGISSQDHFLQENIPFEDHLQTKAFLNEGQTPEDLSHNEQSEKEHS